MLNSLTNLASIPFEISEELDSTCAHLSCLRRQLAPAVLMGPNDVARMTAISPKKTKNYGISLSTNLEWKD